MGKVRAVCISEKRGTQKKNIESAVFVENWGIEGDAHAGNWHRQISLLSEETIAAFKARGAEEALDAQNASAVYTTGEGTGSEVTTPSEGEGTTTTAVAKIGDTAYETLAQAVTAAADDAVIDLKADAVLGATLISTKILPLTVLISTKSLLPIPLAIPI